MGSQSAKRCGFVGLWLLCWAASCSGPTPVIPSDTTEASADAVATTKRPMVALEEGERTLSSDEEQALREVIAQLACRVLKNGLQAKPGTHFAIEPSLVAPLGQILERNGMKLSFYVAAIKAYEHNPSMETSVQEAVAQRCPELARPGEVSQRWLPQSQQWGQAIAWRQEDLSTLPPWEEFGPEERRYIEAASALGCEALSQAPFSGEQREAVLRRYGYDEVGYHQQAFELRTKAAVAPWVAKRLTQCPTRP